MEDTQILIVPGIGDSGDEHWQTYWLKLYPNSVKLIQNNWDEPMLEDWLERMNQMILNLNSKVVIVAHSLGVSLVAHWANRYFNPKVTGAMLVAPADVDFLADTLVVVKSFAPMPLSVLPFSSIVIASDNDPFVTIDRAKYFASVWNSKFVNIGSHGHINSDSNLKFWEEGQGLLNGILKS